MAFYVSQFGNTFLDLLEILGFIVSCNLTFTYLIDFITPVIFKPIVNI